MKRALAPLAGLALTVLAASCGNVESPRAQAADQPRASGPTSIVRPAIPPRNDNPVIEGLTRQQTVRGEVQKFLQALGYSNQAGYLASQQPGLYSNPQLDKIITLRKMAFETARRWISKS